MNSKLPFLFLFFFIPFLNASAQYTEMINTNRPGGSQGAFSVGTNVLQIESGINYGKEKHTLLETESDGLGIDYSVRYGFWKERLEISLMGEFQSNKVVDNRSSTAREYSLSNFKSNTVGAKYLIYDPYRKRELKGPNLYSWKANNRIQWADLIPAISVYAGANFDFADNPFTPEADSSVSPKFILATQNNFIGGWVLVTNIIVDRITTDFPTYGYIVTLTHATNRYFSVFVENQGLKSDFYSDQLLRGGAAALLNENFQVDLSLTVNFKDTPSKFYGRVGVAYRFDMHNKDEYLEDEATKEQKDKKEKVKDEDKKQDRLDELEIEDNGEQ
ncbi:transporter [Aequorivita sp. Q41]|uniref:transporter n=1 Tax=Aequorivita sp. Q41 TaxID=3153300 RepID=UPI003241F377